MRRIAFLFLAAIASQYAQAQTMNVADGTITYAFTAEQVGEMTYSEGTSLTIQGKTFAISDIDLISFSSETVDDNTVSVEYSSSSANVVVAGNIAQYLTVSVTDAKVSIIQDAALPQEVTYTLSGTSSDGQFYMDGELKATVVLNGLTLTNASGAPIQIDNGKRINVVLSDGTTNTLVDSSDGEQKGCFACKGHLEFKDGTGTLNVTGNTKHGIWAKEYIEVKKSTGTINVLSAVSDGIHCNEYYQQNGGEVVIANTGGDGIDADDSGLVIVKGGTINITLATADTKGIKSDSTLTMSDGTITIKVPQQSCHGIKCGTGSEISGGSITETITGAGAKGIKASDDITISGGTINMTHSGTCVVEESDTAKAVCIKGDEGAMAITGGTITLKATGKGGKCINTEGTLQLGTYTSTDLSDIDQETLVLSCTTTGATWGSSSSGGGRGGGPQESSGGVKSKTIRAVGDITINNGYIYCSTSTDGSEGIESKSSLTVNNGYIIQNCYDDCYNAGSTITINGGFNYCYSTGNDAIDSNYSGSTTGTAIGINGGIVFAMGTQSPEEGLDTDRGYINISGGYVFTAGGQQNSSPSVTASQATAYVGSYSLGSSYYTLACGDTKIFTVKAPATMNQCYSILTGPGMTTGTTCYLYYGTSAPTAYDAVYKNKTTNCFWLNPTVTTSSATKSWTQSSLFTSSSSGGGGGGGNQPGGGGGGGRR